MNVKKKIAFISHTITFGLMLNLFIIFLSAYLNDFSVGVYINNYGEAHFEMILFPVTILFCLIGLYFAWRDIKNVMVKKVTTKKREDD